MRGVGAAMRYPKYLLWVDSYDAASGVLSDAPVLFTLGAFSISQLSNTRLFIRFTIAQSLRLLRQIPPFLPHSLTPRFHRRTKHHPQKPHIPSRRTVTSNRLRHLSNLRQRRRYLKKPPHPSVNRNNIQLPPVITPCHTIWA